MTQLTDTRRAELYLRGDTYGTFEAQQAILERARALETGGAVEDLAADWSWDRIRTVGQDHRHGAVETYREFREWAERNGFDLGPAFESRTRGFVGLDRVEDVVVFPVASLAVYDGTDLRAVFPCSDGDVTYRVQDCLAAIERGEHEWLARFEGLSVDRTGPWLDSGLSA